MNDIYMHITYYERDYPFKTIFRQAQEFAYDGIELRWPKEDTEKKIEQIARYRDEYHLKGIIFGGGIRVFCVEDKDTAEDLKSLRKVAKLGKRILGLKIFNFMCGETRIADGARYTEFEKNGSALATDKDYEKCAEVLREASDIAADYDITLVIETHGCLIHDTVRSSVKLVNMVDRPNLKINFDYGNLYCMKNGESLEQIEELLAGKLGYVHLKNVRFTNDYWMFFPKLRDGEIDMNTLIAAIKRLKYDGIICLERPGKGGDPNIAAQEDIAYLRNLLSGNVLDFFEGCV